MKGKVAAVIPTTLLLLNSIYFPSYASASTDIMRQSRFDGAMQSIDWATGFIDHYMTMAITICAFLIITMALFKNVCAGTYLSNVKFWDKVATAHEAAEAKTLANIKDSMKGFATTANMKSVKESVLVFIPNVKALTDFDGQDLSPKQYWLKAIPQMLACIVIGVFIYNGFYRDTAALAGDAGSAILTRVFASTDPDKMIDNLLLTSGTPDNIFANDKTENGKMMKTISMAIYKKYRSIYELKDTTSKTALMRNSEQIAYEFITQYALASDSPLLSSGVEENKVWELQGLKISSSNRNIGAQQIDGTSFYRLTAEDSEVFNTQDGGISYAFTVLHGAPTGANGEASNEIYSDSAFVAISGTFRKVDGKASSQSSSTQATGSTAVMGSASGGTLVLSGTVTVGGETPVSGKVDLSTNTTFRSAIESAVREAYIANLGKSAAEAKKELSDVNVTITWHVSGGGNYSGASGSTVGYALTQNGDGTYTSTAPTEFDVTGSFVLSADGKSETQTVNTTVKINTVTVKW